MMPDYHHRVPLSSIFFLLLNLTLHSIAMPVYSSYTKDTRDPARIMNINNQNGATYPRATHLNNGHILGAYTELSSDNQQILTLVTSTDEGNSWQFTGTAARKPIASGTLDNPFTLQLPSGRVLIAFRNHDIDASGHLKIYRITICSSDDLGASWKFLSDAVVVIATPTKNGVWEPFLRNGADGSLQLYYSYERSDSDQDSVLIISRDGGLTWESENFISGATEYHSRDGMIGVDSIRDGTLLAVFETNENNGPFSLQSVSSTDNGITWSDRKLIYASPPGKNAGAPQISCVGRKVVISFMTDEDNTIVPGKSWIDAADAKMLVSEDGGESWSKSLVFDTPSYWPSLLPLKDQISFLYMAGNQGLKSQRITL